MLTKYADEKKPGHGKCRILQIFSQSKRGLPRHMSLQILAIEHRYRCGLRLVWHDNPSLGLTDYLQDATPEKPHPGSWYDCYLFLLFFLGG